MRPSDNQSFTRVRAILERRGARGLPRWYYTGSAATPWGERAGTIGGARWYYAGGRLLPYGERAGTIGGTRGLYTGSGLVL